MAEFNIPPNATARINLSGTDTLTVATGATLVVSGNAQAVRFNGPTTAAGPVITNSGTIENTAAAGRAIRVETSVGGSFTATITNNATGIVTSPDDAVQIQAGSVTSGTLTLGNAGSITSTDGQALDLAGGTGTFTAHVTNSGTVGSINSDAIRFGAVGNLTNSGIVNGGTAATYSASTDGVQYESGGSGTLINQTGGAISGDRHGINASTGTNVEVQNQLGATLTGRNGSGVGLDGTGTVLNRGTISGNYSNSAGSDANSPGLGGTPDGINDGDGDGVDIDGIATIDNYGRIEGNSAGGHGSDGFANTADGISIGGGVINNYAGGVIFGAGRGILADNSSTGPALGTTTITNAGTIQTNGTYAIRLVGDWADTLDNAGSIEGGVTQLGDGNDTLVLRNGSLISGQVDAELGSDLITYANWTTTGVVIRLDFATATGTSGIAGFERAIGSGQNDTLYGRAAEEILAGGGGDDLIEGGTGDDQLDGGSGVDTVVYGLATQGVFVGLLAQGMAQNTQSAGTDILINFENLSGSGFNDTLGGDNGDNVLDGGNGNDLIFGVGGNDFLRGANGNDTLDGGAGNDVLLGGNGDDVFVVDATLDEAVESSGFDTVFVTVSGWMVSSGVELAYLYASGATLTGSSGEDILVAHASGNSTLSGAGGNDTLWGQAGNDRLSGGTDADILRGGGGNDTLSGGAGNDQLVGGTGADSFAFDLPGFGTDEIFDFSRTDGDMIDMRGSGITSMAGFAFINTIGANTQLVSTGGTINLYGFIGFQNSDFIFS